MSCYLQTLVELYQRQVGCGHSVRPFPQKVLPSELTYQFFPMWAKSKQVVKPFLQSFLHSELHPTILVLAIAVNGQDGGGNPLVCVHLQLPRWDAKGESG